LELSLPPDRWGRAAQSDNFFRHRWWVDGISDFNGLHSRKHDDEVQLYAFDILALEGDDLRSLPLHLRKTNLARLLARRSRPASLAWKA
jgi:ATP-dependent DNA ligase